MDLLDRLKPYAERHAQMKAMGVETITVTNEQVLSPTRAIIDGRETILAGTNNYMGITFDTGFPATLAWYREAGWLPPASRADRSGSTSNRILS